MDGTTSIDYFSLVVVVVLQRRVGQVGASTIRDGNERSVGNTIVGAVTSITRRIEFRVMDTIEWSRRLGIHTVHDDTLHIEGLGHIDQRTKVRPIRVRLSGRGTRSHHVAAWVTVDLHIVLELGTIPSDSLADGQFIHNKDVVARHIAQTVEDEVHRLGRLVRELGAIRIAEVLAIDAIHIEVFTRTETIHLDRDGEGDGTIGTCSTFKVQDFNGKHHITHLRLARSQLVGIEEHRDGKRQRVAALAVAKVHSAIVTSAPNQCAITCVRSLHSILRTCHITPVVGVVRVGQGTNGHGEAVDVESGTTTASTFTRLSANDRTTMCRFNHHTIVLDKVNLLQIELGIFTRLGHIEGGQHHGNHGGLTNVRTTIHTGVNLSSEARSKVHTGVDDKLDGHISCDLALGIALHQLDEHRIECGIGTELVAIGKDKFDSGLVSVVVTVEGLLHRGQIGIGFGVDDVVDIRGLHSLARLNHKAEVEVRVAEDTILTDSCCHGRISSGSTCHLWGGLVILPIHPSLVAQRVGVVGTIEAHHVRTIVDKGVVGTWIVGAVETIITSS